MMDENDQEKLAFDAAKLIASLSTGTIVLGAALLDRLPSGKSDVVFAITFVFISLLFSIFYIFLAVESPAGVTKHQRQLVLRATLFMFGAGVAGLAWFVFSRLL